MDTDGLVDLGSVSGKKQKRPHHLHVPYRTQSRIASIVEAFANTLIGYVIAYVATFILFKIYDVPASHSQIFAVTMWMTVLSVLRGYVLRRAWNAEFWHRLQWPKFWKLKPPTVAVPRNIIHFQGHETIPKAADGSLR